MQVLFSFLEEGCVVVQSDVRLTVIHAVIPEEEGRETHNKQRVCSSFCHSVRKCEKLYDVT